MDIHSGKKTIEKKESAFLSQLANGISTGIGNLLKFAAHLEKQGKSEYIEQGEITGKTRSGKEIRGAYGFGMKVGLDKIQPPREDGKT
ncbi:MAG: hypothetical protein V1770_06470 [bacterium]